MRIAAYCRVSTDKSDQLNSMEAQKSFFLEYANRTGDELIEIYADEGISGTKIKNRTEFLRLMTDAELGVFDMVVVKDISRFARNTVDLLTSVRKLRELGIETQFLTANMTSMGNSEFVLTMFAALAQEESANTSKRVKFGKKLNAEKGRVPNITYGYDKISGDYFSLKINQAEAEIVREIFHLYVKEGFGSGKIAKFLNQKNIKTKRGCNWTQTAICRVLSNELYIGKIINGKEEVADFLTGKRVDKPPDEWLVTINPQLQIVDADTFEAAQKLLKNRTKKFHVDHTRHSNKYLFSTLIKCKDCGWSFRRMVRTYKNTYVRWVCSGRNGKGIEACSNKTSIDETELISALEKYFLHILKQKPNVITHIVNEFNAVYKNSDNNKRKEQLTNALKTLQTRRQRYLDMYADGLISRDELNNKIGTAKQEIEQLNQELSFIEGQALNEKRLKAILQNTFRKIEDLVNLEDITNTQLKQIIEKIEVSKDGEIEIYLKTLSGSGKATPLHLNDGKENQKNFIWLLK